MVYYPGRLNCGNTQFPHGGLPQRGWRRCEPLPRAGSKTHPSADNPHQHLGLVDVSTQGQTAFQLKAWKFPVAISGEFPPDFQYQRSMGASGIRAMGWRGKREMKEENKHKSHTKQIAGSDSIKSDVFKRKY